MKTQTTVEHRYKGVPLKECTYATLKKYALELEIDLKAFKYVNENYMIKAINAKLAEKPPVIPFTEVNRSLTFKVNYAHHLGVSKEEIIEKLCITQKSYVDKVWLYDNANYKNKILEFLNNQTSK